LSIEIFIQLALPAQPAQFIPLAQFTLLNRLCFCLTGMESSFGCYFIGVQKTKHETRNLNPVPFSSTAFH